MSMAESLGALLAHPAASTIEFQDNVDGGPPGATDGGSSSVHHQG
jgi:hypothetical protein